MNKEWAAVLIARALRELLMWDYANDFAEHPEHRRGIVRAAAIARRAKDPEEINRILQLSRVAGIL